ncbi:MAG: FtsX-like permease family protein [Lachnospiraceae bacterium]|nr:FtsX-like permease family protein [Lachnospiraceae bacterium]
MKLSLFRGITKKYIKILIAITLVSSLGCGMMIGMANGTMSLRTTLDEYVGEMHYPQAIIDTGIMKKSVRDDILKVDGILEADTRLTGDLILKTQNGGYYTMQARTCSEDEFQGMFFWEKCETDAEYPIYLEQKFAKINGIHTGDIVNVGGYGRSKECVVAGTVSRPEAIANHSIWGMEILSTDIGYIYIPDEVVDKLEDPDYDAALSEWKEKNGEVDKKEKEANEKFKKVEDELSKAEEELEKGRTELSERKEHADSLIKELADKKNEVGEKLKTLNEAKKELLQKKEELRQGEAELKKAKDELASKEAEFNKAKEELAQARPLLEAGIKELSGQIAELDAKSSELDSLIETLKDSEPLIAEKRAELEDKKKELNDNRKKLVSLRSFLDSLNGLARTLQEQDILPPFFEELVRSIEEATDTHDWAIDVSNKVRKIFPQIFDTLIDKELIPKENTELIREVIKFRTALMIIVNGATKPENIKAARDQILETGKELLEKYRNDEDFFGRLLKDLTAELDSATLEIDNNIALIDEGLEQAAEAEKLINEKEKELKDGLAEAESGKKQLEELKTAADAGMAGLKEQLSKVASGEKEIEKAAAELQNGKAEIRTFEEKLEEGRRQINDGEKEIAEAEPMLMDALDEIEDAAKQIVEKLNEAKDRINEGEDEIKKNREQADKSRIDILGQIAEARAQLEEAKVKLDEWNGYGEYCNQFLLLFDDGADQKAVLAEVEKVLGSENVVKSCSYEDSDVKYSIDVNTDPIEIMSFYVPGVFFLIALIVEGLFMSFMIRQCRREIGILRALGYSSKKIVLMFCVVNSIASAAGILLGLAISFGVSVYMGVFFKEYFCLHFFRQVFAVGRAVISAALTLLVGMAATVASSGYISSISPVEAMSQNMSAGKDVSGKNIIGRLHIAPFVKYCLLSLARNKKRLIFSIICLSSSVVVVFTSISFDLSKNRILTEIFEDRIHYDCEIFLSSAPDEELTSGLTAVGLVNDAEEVSYYKKIIKGREESVERTIKCISKDSKLLDIYDEKGNKVSASDEGIMLEKHTADLLKVSEGDTVLIDGKTVKVAGIPYENIDRYMYLSDSVAGEMGEAELFSVICTVDREKKTELMEYLSEKDNYIYALFTSAVSDGMADAFNAYGLCVIIILIFSAVIGIVIIINTIRTNLYEQKKDICVLRALGFAYSGISLRLFSQSAVYFVFSCLIGIPAGRAVTRFILVKMAIEGRSYPLVWDHRVYLYTLSIIFAYILVGHIVSMRTIKTWDLTESIKDKD